MPAVETQGRTEKCTLWESIGVDNYGKYKVGSAEELMVRWEEKRTQSTDPKNTVITIDATVFVDIEIPIGSIMWRGALAGWPDAVDPDLKEVSFYNEIPDIKGREVTRTVTLVRYNGQLPT